MPVALLLVGVACTSPDPTSDPSPKTTGTATTTTTTTPLPPPVPWVASPADPAPEAKELATEVVQAIGTYPSGGGTIEAARQRIAELAAPAAVAEAGGPLLDPEAAAVVEIVYPQMGGLTERSASVMVVARQRTRVASEESVVTRTIDVRLERTSAGWSVTELASLGGDPPPEATPSAVGRLVLEEPRIELPDSSVWDIEAGRVGDPILQRLLDLSVDHVVSVTVLATGHPHNVFDREFVSNHTVGRGVDIWAIDGISVLDQRAEDSPLIGLVQTELAAGVTELGSPWDLDGPGGPSFTNAVHQDHLHLAYDAP